MSCHYWGAESKLKLWIKAQKELTVCPWKHLRLTLRAEGATVAKGQESHSLESDYGASWESVSITFPLL